MRYVERYIERCDDKRHHSKIVGKNLVNQQSKLDNLESIRFDKLELEDDDLKNDAKIIKTSDSNPLHALLNNLCYQVVYCDDKHQKTKNDYIIIKWLTKS